MSDATASRARERLAVFVGEWHTQGRQIAGTVGPAAKVTATESYEWLAGGHFLIHHFRGSVGDSDASCVEIIGHDAASSSYPVHTYYGNGLRNEWQYAAPEGDGRTWILTGEWKTGDTPMQVRCTLVFDVAGDAMTGNWEQSADGAKWQTFWDLRATRVTK